MPTLQSKLNTLLKSDVNCKQITQAAIRNALETFKLRLSEKKKK